jgi:hypothetical protein
LLKHISSENANSPQSRQRTIAKPHGNCVKVGMGVARILACCLGAIGASTVRR